MRSLWKLHALHNQYVLAVQAASLHHQHHYQRVLPSLHQSLYGLQQEMVLVLKEILSEYCSISSLVQEDLLAVHQEIASAIQAIDPATEYSSFIQSHQYGSTQPQPLCWVRPCCHWLAVASTGQVEAQLSWLPTGTNLRCHQLCPLMRACWRTQKTSCRGSCS